MKQIDFDGVSVPNNESAVSVHNIESHDIPLPDDEPDADERERFKKLCIKVFDDFEPDSVDKLFKTVNDCFLPETREELMRIAAAEAAERISNCDKNGLAREDLHRCVLKFEQADGYAGETVFNALENRATDLKCKNNIKRLLKAFTTREMQKNAAETGEHITDFTGQPITLSCGTWTADDDGIYRNDVSSTGMLERKYATRTPLLITEILENIDSDTKKIRIAYRMRGRWKTTVVSAKMLCETRKITDLADYGIDVTSNTAKLLVDYFQTLRTGNSSIIPVHSSIGHMGWTEDGGFSPYSGLAFDGEDEFRQLFNAVQAKGNYEQWKKTMSELRKNLYFRLQMAASFAAPLLTRLDTLSFILHFYGGSGSGKTVGLMCAASVWGDPHPGKMWRTLNNTVNYIMNVAGTFCNIPVMLDELQVIKNTFMNYDQLIMRLCSGTDRGRMMSGRRLDEMKTWNTAFLTTGEEPILRENSGGGSINRVIEIDCNGKYIVPLGQGNKTVSFVLENYGYAGKEYIEALKKHTNLRAIYSNYLNRLLKETNTTEKQATAMAAMLTADLVAAAHIFDGEMPLDAKDVAELLVDEKTFDMTERAYEFVLNTIAANEHKFKQNGIEAASECWGRINNDETVLFNKTALMKILLDAGYDFNACKKKWSAKGYLEKNSQDKYIHQTKVGNIKSAYVKLRLRPFGFEYIDRDSDDWVEPPFKYKHENMPRLF